MVNFIFITNLYNFENALKATCTPQHILSSNDTLYIHFHRSSKMKWQNLLEFQDALVYGKNAWNKSAKAECKTMNAFFPPTAQLNGTAGILNTSYPTQVVNHVIFLAVERVLEVKR